MRTRTSLTVIVLGVALAGGAWWWFGRSNPDEPTSSDRGTATGATTGRSQEPALPGAADRPALDCAKPSGNAALVDDQPISAERLCSTLSRIGGVSAGGVDRKQAELVLDQMIDGMIVRRALDSLNAVVTDAEVDAAAKQLGVATPAPGVDVALVKEQLRERLELRKLASTRAKLDVTEPEVDAELARGAPGIDRGQGVRVDGWMIRVAHNADPSAHAAAEKAAKAFAAAIPAQPPADAAKKLGLSAVPPAVIGGSGLEPELEEAALALAKGAWSHAIKTKVGWIVIRSLGRVEGTAMDDKDLRQRVRAALETRKAAGASKDLLIGLRNAAKIDVLVDL